MTMNLLRKCVAALLYLYQMTIIRTTTIAIKIYVSNNEDDDNYCLKFVKYTRL